MWGCNVDSGCSTATRSSPNHSLPRLALEVGSYIYTLPPPPGGLGPFGCGDAGALPLPLPGAGAPAGALPPRTICSTCRITGPTSGSLMYSPVEPGFSIIACGAASARLPLRSQSGG